MSEYTTIQVANKVGVHPNTVRLYEKWGYISPVLRQPNGYRVFTQKHLKEMKVARIAFPGPYPVNSKPLFKMIKSYISNDKDKALKCVYEYKNSVLDELSKTDKALTILDQWSKEQYGSSRIIAHSRREFAEISNLSIDTIRTWERNNLFQPTTDDVRKKYSELDYEKVQVIRLLRKRGFSIASLAEVFNFNKEIKPSVYLKYVYKNKESVCEADEWINHLHDHLSRCERLIAEISS